MARIQLRSLSPLMPLLLLLSTLLCHSIHALKYDAGQIKQMSLSQLKEFLTIAGNPCTGCIEKEHFVDEALKFADKEITPPPISEEKVSSQDKDKESTLKQQDFQLQAEQLLKKVREAQERLKRVKKEDPEKNVTPGESPKQEPPKAKIEDSPTFPQEQQQARSSPEKEPSTTGYQKVLLDYLQIAQQYGTRFLSSSKDHLLHYGGIMYDLTCHYGREGWIQLGHLTRYGYGKSLQAKDYLVQRYTSYMAGREKQQAKKEEL